LVLKGRPLLLDLLKTLLLGAELRPDRRQLFAHCMQAPFIVLELSLSPLQFRLPLREPGSSLRGAYLGDGKRLLDILEPLGQFLVSNAQPIAVQRQDGVVSPQAFVRFAQPLKLALRLEVGDFRSLDLDERLINRTQGFVELRTDGLDIAE
jgi:hypothetical protein